MNPMIRVLTELFVPIIVQPLEEPELHRWESAKRGVEQVQMEDTVVRVTLPVQLVMLAEVVEAVYLFLPNPEEPVVALAVVDLVRVIGVPPKRNVMQRTEPVAQEPDIVNQTIWYAVVSQPVAVVVAIHNQLLFHKKAAVVDPVLKILTVHSRLPDSNQFVSMENV
jgi:hypothetical protein